MSDLSNENIIHIKHNGIEYLQFKRLLDNPNLQHAFTLKPLDFAGISDYEQKKKMVKENNQKICQVLGINPDCMYRPKQTHTANVAIVEHQPSGIFQKEFENIDALITNQKEKALVLAFADCTPLLFYDPIKIVIANVHSGWRGTLQKIGVNTLKRMISYYGCNPEDVICCIGPTIRKCHFEVDKDVKNLFYEQFKNEMNIEQYIFNMKEKNKYYIDTVEINKQVLINNGLKQNNIIDSKICSVCHHKDIHSYRAQGKNAGRNIAIMQLK